MEKIVCDPLFWCSDAGMLLIWGYNLGCNWAPHIFIDMCTHTYIYLYIRAHIRIHRQLPVILMNTCMHACRIWRRNTSWTCTLRSLCWTPRTPTRRWAPGSPAWQYSLVTPPPLAWQGLTLEKLYLFHMNSDGDDFYTKIVALNEIYNFVVLIFFSFEVIKMVK